MTTMNWDRSRKEVMARRHGSTFVGHGCDYAPLGSGKVVASRIRGYVLRGELPKPSLQATVHRQHQTELEALVALSAIPGTKQWHKKGIAYQRQVKVEISDARKKILEKINSITDAALRNKSLATAANAQRLLNRLESHIS
jgi:hypothetical protein